MIQYRISATLDSGRQVDFLLEAGAVVIGRDPKCAICLPSDSVSRNHARLTLGETTVTVEDIDSTAGTFVGEQAISAPVPLTCPATFSRNDAVELGTLPFNAETQRTQRGAERQPPKTTER